MRICCPPYSDGFLFGHGSDLGVLRSLIGRKATESDVISLVLDSVGWTGSLTVLLYVDSGLKFSSDLFRSEFKPKIEISRFRWRVHKSVMGLGIYCLAGGFFGLRTLMFGGFGSEMGNYTKMVTKRLAEIGTDLLADAGCRPNRERNTVGDVAIFWPPRQCRCSVVKWGVFLVLPLGPGFW